MKVQVGKRLSIVSRHEAYGLFRVISRRSPREIVVRRVSRCTNHNVAKFPPYVKGDKGRCCSDVEAGKMDLVVGGSYVEAIIL